MAKTWNIYRTISGQSTVLATVHELEYHGEWMGDVYVNVTIRTAEPLELRIGDYLTYRGERFEINYEPNFLKKARSGSYGEGFNYENVKFYSIAARLKDAGFKDVVLNDMYDNANKLVYSSLGTFSFFAASVEDLADRIQANLNRMYGNGEWRVYTPTRARTQQRLGGDYAWALYYDQTPASFGKTEINVSVSDVSCFDALKLAYTEFELSFYTKQKEIIIGGKPIGAGYDFEYGKGNGLYEIERTSDDSQRIVTKLFAYGSEKNIPLNYYANLHKRAFITGSKLQYQIIYGEPIYSIYTSIPKTLVQGLITEGKDITIKNGNTTINGWFDFMNEVENLQADGTGWNLTYSGNMFLRLTIDYHDSRAASFFNSYSNGGKLYINGVNVNTWPTDYVENTAAAGQNYPALLSINRLMLPGFPDESLFTWVVNDGATNVNTSTGYAVWKGYAAYFSKDQMDPWIKSVNADAIGEREGTVNFDSDDDEIYPSIEGTGYDEVYSCDQMDDNGYLEDTKEAKKTFELIPKLVSGNDGGIEWNYSAETVSISMKDGYCVGREFKVQTAKKNGETGMWHLTLERQADSSLANRYFPYKHDNNGLYQVSANDKFVILGIPLPSTFVEMAAEKLLEEALKQLAKVDHQTYTYLPKIDEIEMARQHDAATANNTESVYYKICAGMQMHIEDDDLGLDYYPFIDNITIKDPGNNGIPTFDVVLKDEKEMTMLEKIQSEIRGGTEAALNGIDGAGQGEFLSRLFDDSAEGFITFMKGFQVGERFVSGLLGEGGVFRTEEDGRTYIEADNLYIRMKAYFDTVEIRKWMHSAGNRIATLAGMKCVRVLPLDASNNVVSDADDAVKFRCFFRGHNGDEEITNDFVVGDMAYCHITNVVSSNEMYNHHFWRLVVDKSASPDNNGDHWIDLSNKSSETLTISGTSYTRNGYLAGSDIPTEQDDIIQLGNIADSTRRGAIIEYVSGADAPSYQIFQGIGTDSPNPFVLTGKNYVSMGYASGNTSLHSAGHAYLEVMGDFYFGDIDVANPSTYIKYNSTTKQLDIKANVKFTSPYTQQETDLEAFANAVKSNEEYLQQQIDGEIDSWFYAGVPTLENAPAVDWTTTELKDKHLGDLYYDKNTGYAYRFVYDSDNSVYEWTQIYDDAIAEALRIANEAQDTADHKRRVFVARPTTADAYDVGDLWVNATYSTTYSNDLLRCKTAKASGASFKISHWQLATKYTDDSALTDFVTNTYASDKTNLQQQIDGKAETWYQSTNPASSWSTDEDKAKHVGDLWYCTADIADTDYKKGTTWFYKATTVDGVTTYEWEEQEVPEEVFDKIDGKSSIYTNASNTPPTNYKKNDLWILPAAATINGTSYPLGEVLTALQDSSTFVASHWTKKVRYTDDTALTTFINGSYATTVQQLSTQIDGKADTWYQDSDPSTSWTTNDLKASHVGDLWYKSSDGTTWYYKDNGASVNPRYAWAEQDVPDSVFDKIDGKSSIFVSQPSDYKANDLWILAANTTVNGTEYKQGEVLTSSSDSATFVASHWSKKVRYTDDSSLTTFLNGTYATDVANLQQQIDRKAETWYQATDPSTAWTTAELKAAHVGDLWHNSASSTVAGIESGMDGMWNGTSWVPSEVPQDVYDKIDGKSTIYASKPTSYEANDLWIIESGATNIPSNCVVGDIVIADNMPSGTTSRTSYVSSDWRKKDRYTDDSTVNEIISNYGNILNIQSPTASNVGSALGYLYAILNHPEGTTISGGLVLTSLISLRDTSSTPKIWGGISGTYQTSENTTIGNYVYKGHGTAAWYGGAMVDYEGLTDTQKGDGWDVHRWARSLFRFDGSGYVANGNLSWDASGNVTLQGYSINATSLQKNGFSVATENDLAGYLPLSGGTLTGGLYLSNNIHIYGKTTGGANSSLMYLSTSNNLVIGSGQTSNTTYIGGYEVCLRYGSSKTTGLTLNSAGLVYLKRSLVLGSADETYIQIGGIRIVYDQTNNALKVVQSDGTTAANFYTTGAVSAFGMSSGGGGGSISLNQPLADINEAGLSQLTTASDAGKTIVFNGSSWVYSTATTLKANAMNVSSTLTVGSTISTGGTVSAVGVQATGAYGFRLSGKDDTYVLLAGGGSMLISDISGSGGTVTGIKIGSSATEYTPTNGIVTLPAYPSTSGFVTGISLNGGNPVAPSNGIVSLSGIVTSISVNSTSYTPSSGVVTLPNFITGISSSDVTTALGFTPAASSDLNNYLPLSGGTLTGNVFFDTGNATNEKYLYFDINRNDSSRTGAWSYRHICIRDVNDTTFYGYGVFGECGTLSYGYIGAGSYNSTNNLRIYPTYPAWGTNKIWHEGNDGSGSGLDADLLDGKHASELLTALSSSKATNLSITVGGTTESITSLYATEARYLKYGYGAGQGNNSKPYKLVAEYVSPTTTGTRDAGALFVVSDYYYNKNGILHIRARVNNNASVITEAYTDARWLVKSPNLDVKKFILTTKATSNTLVCRLYYYVGSSSSSWEHARFTVIDEGIWYGKSDLWTMYDAYANKYSYTEIPSDETQIVSVDESTCSNALKLNGQDASYYATSGDLSTVQGYFTNGVANEAAKLSTVSKTAWGQTYWTSGGVPDSISGDMSSVGNITMSGNVKMNVGKAISIYYDDAYYDTLGMWGGTLKLVHLNYYLANSKSIPLNIYGNTIVLFSKQGGTLTQGIKLDTSGNVAIGTGNPSYRLHVKGTFYASGDSSIGGTFGVTGATTLSSTLAVTGATTLTGLLTANGNIQTGSSNGAYIQIGAVKLIYDSTNNALKVEKSDGTTANFYATGAVSAFGVSSGQQLTLNEPLESINNSSMIAPTSSQAGNTLVYNGSTWVYSGGAQLKANTLSISSSLSAYSGTFGSTLSVAGSVTSQSGGFIVNGKDNTYVLLAGGGTKLLSEISGGGGTVTGIKIGTSATEYTPTEGIVTLPAYPSTSGFVTGISVNGGNPIQPSSGVVSLGIYAPTGTGTARQVLLSTGSTTKVPVWTTGEIIRVATSVNGTAGNNTSGTQNRTTWTATTGATALYNGMMVQIKIPVAGVSSVATTLNIDSLGEHPVLMNASTNLTSHFGAGAVLVLSYDSSASATVYINGTSTTITGCWKFADYGSSYSAGTAAQITAGTNTTNRVWSAKILHDYVEGLGYVTTDTKNTAGISNLAETKLFLIGGTQQTDGLRTYSNINCYIGKDNCMYSNGSRVVVGKSLSNEDLNDITNEGFYNSGGGNTVANKPSGVTSFGMEVIHTASGSYYEQILYVSANNIPYRRYCSNGTWGDWVRDVLTDENVEIKTTNPSSGTWYYPVWYTAASGTGNLNANDGFRYYSLQGTASAVGNTYIQIGNSTASGTAGNKRGYLRIYGTGAKYGQFAGGDNLTADRTYTLPNATGTLALTSDIPTNNNQLTNGAGYITSSGSCAYAEDANKLDGYHASTSSTPFGTIPVIVEGGWMEVGNSFEMHYDNTTGSDFSTRLYCTGNHSNSVALPSASGTLALLSDCVERLNWWNETDTHNVNDLRCGTTFAYSTHGAPSAGTIAAFCSKDHTGYTLQISGSYSGNDLYYRNRNGDNSTWGSWKRVVEASELSNYYPLTGGVLNGNMYALGTVIDINRNGSTGALGDTSKLGFEIECNANDVNLIAYNSSGASGYICFPYNNVGIGTGSPSAKLHVSGTLWCDHGLISGNLDTASIKNTSSFCVGNATNDALWFGQMSAGWGFIQSAYYGISGTTSAAHTYPLVLQPIGGNVGIGTTSPSYKLTVNGSIFGTGIYNSSYYYMPGANNTFISTIDQYSNYAPIFGYGQGVYGYDVYYTGRNVHICGGSNWSSPDGINIDATNNIGIGTSSPSYKLDVNGYTSTTRLYLASGVYFEKDSNGVHLVGAGFYSDSFISAFGVSSGGGSSTLNEPLSGINSAGLSAPTSSGTALIFNGTSWVYSTSSTATLSVSGRISTNGNMTATGTITSSAGNLVVSSGSAGIGGAVSSSYKLTVYGSVNFNSFTIGLSNSQYNMSTSNKHLYVNTGTGTPYVNKSWSVTSDVRLKDIITNVGTSVERIADAPIFNFRYNGENDANLGSSAQYWKDVFSCAVKESPNGYYSLDYSATALAAAVITARKVVSHEERIAALEAENKKLREEINELKAA